MASPYSTPENQDLGEYSHQVQSDVRSLQMITGAMAMGIVTLTGVMLTLNDGELVMKPETLSIVGIIMAAMFVMNSLVIPNLIVSSQLKKIDSSQVRTAAPQEKYAMVSPAYRIRHIIGCALLEGAAFFNLVVYMLTSFAGNLGAASLLLVVMLLRFPTASRINSWTQERLRELELA